MKKKKIYKIDEIFGHNLQTARKLRNLSQEKFSEMIGIERTALSNIERGIFAPSQETLEKIIEVLNIKPYLLYISTEKELDIEKAHAEMIGKLENLKGNRELFRCAYDFIMELSLGV